VNSIDEIIQQYGHHNRWKGVRRMNNAQAIGYALIAAEVAFKFNKHQLEQLERSMRTAMDQHTEEEAEEVYNKN